MRFIFEQIHRDLLCAQMVISLGVETIYSRFPLDGLMYVCMFTTYPSLRGPLGIIETSLRRGFQGHTLGFSNTPLKLRITFKFHDMNRVDVKSAPYPLTFLEQGLKEGASALPFPC